LHSGVHATIAGVLIALTIPMGSKKEDEAAASSRSDDEEAAAGHGESHDHHPSRPLHRLEHGLSPWVAYFIMPTFALFNAGVPLADASASPVSLGVFFGLLLGKPVGIVLFSLLAIVLGAATMPRNSNLWHLLGPGILAGVGFTMSLFIANLAFKGVEGQVTLVNQSSLAIFAASISAGVLGIIAMIIASKARKSA